MNGSIIQLQAWKGEAAKVRYRLAAFDFRRASGSGSKNQVGIALGELVTAEEEYARCGFRPIIIEDILAFGDEELDAAFGARLAVYERAVYSAAEFERSQSSMTHRQALGAYTQGIKSLRQRLDERRRQRWHRDNIR